MMKRSRLPRLAVRLAVVFSLAIAVAGMPGCGLFGGGTAEDSGVNLIAAPNNPIADVPIPAGFALVKSKSTSRVIPSSNVRFVDHLYSGNDDFLPVVRFYRDQLPTSGWKLVDQRQTGSEMTLHFTKNNEDCFVTVRSGTLNTHVRVRIDPMGRNAR